MEVSSLFLIFVSFAHLVSESMSQNPIEPDEFGPVTQILLRKKRIIEIFASYGCATADPEGVCLDGTTPDCIELIDVGRCVLNSCKLMNPIDRDIVAANLAEIDNLSHECGITKEDILYNSSVAPGPAFYSHTSLLTALSTFSFLYSR